MEPTSIRSKIAGLDKGESITFSLEDVIYSTIRSYSYTLALETGNTYSTKVNKADRLLTISRTA